MTAGYNEGVASWKRFRKLLERLPATSCIYHFWEENKMKRREMKWLALALAAALPVGLLAGCGSNAAGDGQQGAAADNTQTADNTAAGTDAADTSGAGTDAAGGAGSVYY